MKITCMRRKFILLITIVGLLGITGCSPDQCPTFDLIGIANLMGSIL